MRAPRLLLLATGLVAAHLAWTVSSALALREVGGSLMPAAGGRLNQLEIQFGATGAELFLQVYRELFWALDPSTELVVTVEGPEDQARFEEAVEAMFVETWRRPPTLRFVHTGRPITSWARDRLAVLGGSDGDPTTLLAPPAPMVGPAERVHDWTVPWVLGEQLPGLPTVRIAPFLFEGGDLIADEKHVFVATPLFLRNPELDPEALLALVEETTGLTAVRVDAPDQPSPDHHIGMFVTPLGDGRVAVADPELGFELLEANGALRDDLRIEIGGGELTLDVNEQRLERFRTVRRQLTRAGFEVIALPALPTTSRYVLASWNNALMEHRDGALQIYLPTYGLPALDAHATEILEAEGARVHPIRVDRLFRLGGSVRCLTAPLRRD